MRLVVQEEGVPLAGPVEMRSGAVLAVVEYRVQQPPLAWLVAVLYGPVAVEAVEAV